LKALLNALKNTKACGGNGQVGLYSKIMQLEKTIIFTQLKTISP
jgi:hypothetical protein